MNLILLGSLMAMGAAGQVIDQQALPAGPAYLVNAYQGRPVAQDFTAGITGHLTRIDLGLNSLGGPVDVLVSVYSADSSGEPYYPAFGALASVVVSIPFSVPWSNLRQIDISSEWFFVNAGSRYAILIEPLALTGLGLRLTYPSAYVGHAAWQYSPPPAVVPWNQVNSPATISGSANLGFQTWVDANATAPLAAPIFETFDGAFPGSGGCTLSTAGSLPAGWSTGIGGAASWAVMTGTSSTPGTGPVGGVGGAGNYVHVDGSGSCWASDFSLISPAVNMTGIPNPVVAFRVHRTGSEMGTLIVEEGDGQGVWTTIGQVAAAFADGWYYTEFPLSLSVATVRFRSVGATGASSNMAIDNVLFGTGTGIGNNFPAPMGPEFQSNSMVSSMSVSMSPIPRGTFTSVRWGSSLVGAPYELMVNLGLPVGLSAGGFQTAGLQTINVPLNFATLVFLNQSLLGTLDRHPGTVTANVFGGTSLQACAQQYVLDPASPDGVTFSAAAVLEVL